MSQEMESPVLNEEVDVETPANSSEAEKAEESESEYKEVKFRARKRKHDALKEQLKQFKKEERARIRAEKRAAKKPAKVRDRLSVFEDPTYKPYLEEHGWKKFENKYPRRALEEYKKLIPENERPTSLSSLVQ